MPAPTVDARTLLALRGSMRPDQFATLLGLFSKDLVTRLRALDSAARAEDRARLAVEAHQLRGSAANMGAMALADASTQLEDMAPTAPAAELRRAVNAFMAMAAEAQAEIERLCPEPD
ncbi:Hpt domain-containing protein [Rhodovarius crocodyli]|nr:Hpt domain-containing protein [Rhodovarius crocodyli]